MIWCPTMIPLGMVTQIDHSYFKPCSKHFKNEAPQLPIQACVDLPELYYLLVQRLQHDSQNAIGKGLTDRCQVTAVLHVGLQPDCGFAGTAHPQKHRVPLPMDRVLKPTLLPHLVLIYRPYQQLVFRTSRLHDVADLLEFYLLQTVSH